LSRVGLIGGSFDPIHIGHCVLAEEARRQRALDRVIFVPAARSPHKSGEARATPDQRLRMVEAAIAGCPAFEASDVELRRGGISYTIDTVEHLVRDRPGDDLVFLAGADILSDLPDWHRIDDLLRLLHFAVAGRPGSEENVLASLEARLGRAAVRDLAENRVETPLLEISSSDIRERVREGWSIRHLVPEAVERIIREERLYRSR
jgi:nicotinate-nucleotide adenylyltransferase